MDPWPVPASMSMSPPPPAMALGSGEFAFSLGETIGVGATGKVKLGVHKETGQREEKYLIATSEQPICAYHQKEWLKEAKEGKAKGPNDLPIEEQG